MKWQNVSVPATRPATKTTPIVATIRSFISDQSSRGSSRSLPSANLPSISKSEHRGQAHDSPETDSLNNHDISVPWTVVSSTVSTPLLGILNLSSSGGFISSRSQTHGSSEKDSQNGQSASFLGVVAPSTVSAPPLGLSDLYSFIESTSRFTEREGPTSSFPKTSVGFTPTTSRALPLATVAGGNSRLFSAAIGLASISNPASEGDASSTAIYSMVTTFYAIIVSEEKPESTSAGWLSYDSISLVNRTTVHAVDTLPWSKLQSHSETVPQHPGTLDDRLTSPTLFVSSSQGDSTVPGTLGSVTASTPYDSDDPEDSDSTSPSHVGMISGVVGGVALLSVAATAVAYILRRRIVRRRYERRRYERLAPYSRFSAWS